MKSIKSWNVGIKKNKILPLVVSAFLFQCGVSPSEQNERPPEKQNSDQSSDEPAESPEGNLDDAGVDISQAQNLPLIQMITDFSYISRQSVHKWEVSIESISPTTGQQDLPDSLSRVFEGLQGNRIELDDVISPGKKLLTIKGFDNYEILKAMGTIPFELPIEDSSLVVPVKDIPPENIAVKGIVDVIRTRPGASAFKFQHLISKMQANCAFAGCHSNDSSSNTKLEQFPFKYGGYEVTMGEFILDGFIKKVIERAELEWSDPNFMPRQTDITDDQKGEAFSEAEVNDLRAWGKELSLPEISKVDEILVKVLKIKVTEFADPQAQRLMDHWHVYFVDPYKPFDLNLQPNKKYRLDLQLLGNEDEILVSKWINIDTGESRTFSTSLQLTENNY